VRDLCACGLALAALGGVTSACTDLQTAPSANPSPNAVVLTVRVQTRTTEAPIEGARVRTSRAEAYTDGTGQARLAVPPGVETTVAVSAGGYEAMTASGVLLDNERWTFYLAALDVPPARPSARGVR
jgi:hypothetical protein